MFFLFDIATAAWRRLARVSCSEQRGLVRSGKKNTFSLFVWKKNA